MALLTVPTRPDLSPRDEETFVRHLGRKLSNEEKHLLALSELALGPPSNGNDHDDLRTVSESLIKRSGELMERSSNEIQRSRAIWRRLSDLTGLPSLN